MKRRRSMLERMSIALAAFLGVAAALTIAAGRPVMVGVLALMDSLGFIPPSGATIQVPGGFTVAAPPFWIQRTAEIAAGIVSLLPAFWVAIATYHRLTFNPVLLDGRTRCGQCGAVMNGLTEPRCTACGEAI